MQTANARSPAAAAAAATAATAPGLARLPAKSPPLKQRPPALAVAAAPLYRRRPPSPPPSSPCRGATTSASALAAAAPSSPLRPPRPVTAQWLRSPGASSVLGDFAAEGPSEEENDGPVVMEDAETDGDGDYNSVVATATQPAAASAVQSARGRAQTKAPKKAQKKKKRARDAASSSPAAQTADDERAEYAPTSTAPYFILDEDDIDAIFRTVPIPDSDQDDVNYDPRRGARRRGQRRARPRASSGGRSAGGGGRSRSSKSATKRAVSPERAENAGKAGTTTGVSRPAGASDAEKENIDPLGGVEDASPDSRAACKPPLGGLCDETSAAAAALSTKRRKLAGPAAWTPP
ncbi:hypothetical protein HK405_001051, partial [Cladochytrium tenue]